MVWKAKVGTQEANDFEQFLQACPGEIKNKLAREPLLLYLLARMHREQRLNVQMFVNADLKPGGSAGFVCVAPGL